MRSPRRLLLLLAAGLLGGLCRSGQAQGTTTSAMSATTTKGSSASAATTPKTETSGSVTLRPAPSASASPTPGKQTTPRTTNPALQPTQGSAATVQKPTSKDASPTTLNPPQTSPSGASSAKPPSPVPSSATVATLTPAAPPTTRAAATAAASPAQTTRPASAADSTTGTTSSSRTTAKAVANASPHEETSKPPTENPTASSGPSQGPVPTKQGTVPSHQSTDITTKGPHTGSSGGSGPHVPPTARQTTTLQVTQPTTDKKPAETHGATGHQSSAQPATSSPGVLHMTSSPQAHPPQEGRPLDGQANETWSRTQFLCEGEISSAPNNVILTLNQAMPCENFIRSSLEGPLLDMICRTLKPNFNRTRDHCLVKLASVTNQPNTVAVVDVSMQINSVADELFESLKIKEGELKKLGVNVSYAGQDMDMDSEDRFSMPLIITIVCMAASLLLVAAIYGCCHQRISQRKDQQRLTEELQTMENGYHDNPTLEVMETSSEMQEKKVNLNGELGDSWIVPMDSLTKEDLGEEEDTHL